MNDTMFVTGSHEETMFEFSPPKWQAEAACLPHRMPDVWQPFAEKLPDFFFPEGKGKIVAAWRRAINEVCSACPVQQECLEHGLKHEADGWWGGAPPKVRVQLRRERGIIVDTPEIDRRYHLVMGTFIPPSHGTAARFRLHKREGSEPCAACIEANRQYFHAYTVEKYAEWKRTATPEEKAEHIRQTHARQRTRGTNWPGQSAAERRVASEAEEE